MNDFNPSKLGEDSLLGRNSAVSPGVGDTTNAPTWVQLKAGRDKRSAGCSSLENSTRSAMSGMLTGASDAIEKMLDAGDWAAILTASTMIGGGVMGNSISSRSVDMSSSSSVVEAQTMFSRRLNQTTTTDDA